MIVYLPALLVCIVGIIIYLTTARENIEMKEVGRICFWVGLLAFLLQWHPTTPIVIGK